jgi:ribosome-associated heat shock protein Hsp15
MSSQKEFNPRIDKWLWAVRVFKTRTMAANACKKGNVQINGINAKSSHPVKVGDVIEVKNPPITRIYNVLGLVEKRMSAKWVPDFMEEVTPSHELKKLKMIQSTHFFMGQKRRPSKKERRAIEKLKKRGML